MMKRLFGFRRFVMAPLLLLPPFISVFFMKYAG